MQMFFQSCLKLSSASGERVKRQKAMGCCRIQIGTTWKWERIFQRGKFQKGSGVSVADITPHQAELMGERRYQHWLQLLCCLMCTQPTHQSTALQEEQLADPIAWGNSLIEHSCAWETHWLCQLSTAQGSYLPTNPYCSSGILSQTSATAEIGEDLSSFSS